MSFELEERFFSFAKKVRDFCFEIEMTIINKPYIIQLIRASSSIGANYIEASDNLGKNDELMKLKISRREAKESVFWLKLLMINCAALNKERTILIDESEQIKKILSVIILKLS